MDQLSFKLDQGTIKKLNDLQNLFAQQYAFLKSLPNDQKETIHHYARISMIGASTRIENAQLTDSEINWMDTVLTKDSQVTSFVSHAEMIKDKLSKDRERSIEEVAGCRQLLSLIYTQHKDFIPLTETTLIGLHKELLKYYQKAKYHAGKYKTQSNSVVEKNHQTGNLRVVFQTADPGPMTSAAMRDLVFWFNEVQLTNSWPIAVACEFVFRFLAIHPFQDGNGRLGRGLFLMSLLNAPYTIISDVAPYLPIDRFIEKQREDYYAALNRCSDGIYQQDTKTYQIPHFLNFMIRVLTDALESIPELKDRFDTENKLSPSALKVLGCFRDFPEKRLTTSEVIERTGIERRTVIRSFNQLIDSGLIQKYGQGAGTRYQITF